MSRALTRLALGLVAGFAAGLVPGLAPAGPVEPTTAARGPVAPASPAPARGQDAGGGTGDPGASSTATGPATGEGAVAPGPLRVACLGDSITFGSAMGEGVDRRLAAWPAQLGAMLGDGHEVRNFGVGGTTLLRAADAPYVGTDAWREALAWAPDLAVVLLGTNDSCAGPARDNWQHAADLAEDAAALAEELLEAGVRRVLLCGPTAMQVDHPGLSEARIADLTARAPHLDEVRAALVEVAASRPAVEALDLGRVLRPGQTTDGVHPTPFGAEAIALVLVRVLAPARGQDPALLARPSVEYRGHAAGWGGGTWTDQVERMVATARVHPDVELVFLGDSITQGLTGSAERMTRPDGTRAIDRAFGDLVTLDLGLSGDRTEHALWRIEHGALAQVDPRVIVVQLGANNLNAAGHSASQTLRGLDAILASLARQEPRARVVLCGPFPLGTSPEEERRHRAVAVHEALPALAERHPGVRYLDLWPLFLDEEGAAKDTLAADGIHVTAAGRAAWMGALEPLVRELLAE